MTTEPTPWLDRRKARRILGLAGPVILAMLTQTGVNVVDTTEPTHCVPMNRTRSLSAY